MLTEDKKRAAIWDLFVSTTLDHQGPDIPSSQHLPHPTHPIFWVFPSSLCLFWSSLSPGTHWGKYQVSQKQLERRLASLHLLVYRAVFTMSWATNQPLYTIHTGGGVNGGSQWVLVLDWSRQNYHVNILLCIRWYDTHTLSGCVFPL